MCRSHNVFRYVLQKFSFLVMCFTTTYLFMKQQALFVNMTERFQKDICHVYSNKICKYIYIYQALYIYKIQRRSRYGPSDMVEMAILAYTKFENTQCTICPLFSTTTCTGFVFWNLFASIFSTSVETNYLDRSNAARVLLANCLSPFFGRKELFMHVYRYIIWQ